jgi:hypothetical protein
MLHATVAMIAEVSMFTTKTAPITAQGKTAYESGHWNDPNLGTGEKRRGVGRRPDSVTSGRVKKISAGTVQRATTLSVRGRRVSKM